MKIGPGRRIEQTFDYDRYEIVTKFTACRLDRQFGHIGVVYVTSEGVRFAPITT